MKVIVGIVWLERNRNNVMRTNRMTEAARYTYIRILVFIESMDIDRWIWQKESSSGYQAECGLAQSVFFNVDD